MANVNFHTSNFFISVPTSHTPRWKLEVTHSGTTDDQTSRIDHMMWTEVATEGLGRFEIRLIDNDDTLGGKYDNDDTVVIYADNSAGTTERFYGVIDSAESERTERGQFLILKGRHVGGELLDVLVTKEYASQDCSSILKDLADTFVSGFTYNNVAASTGVDYEANWSGKPFWDCVKELCYWSGHDCYVDNDKDLHFFQKSSTLTTSDAVVYGDNVLPDGATGFGKDAFYQRNRIRVKGRDDEGRPVIYTTPDVSGNYKEKLVEDSSLRTMAQVRLRHDQELARLGSVESRGTAKTYALMNTNPGDMVWVSMPELKVLKKYRVVEMRHEIGRRVPCKWMTTATLEDKPKDDADLYKDAVDRSVNLQDTDNKNNLDYTYNFTFDNYANIASSPGTGISDGSLVLDSGATGGSMVTNGMQNPASGNITHAEVRATGGDLKSCVFYVGTDGKNWQQVSLSTLTPLENPGKAIFLKVEMKQDALNLNPSLDSLVCLFGNPEAYSGHLPDPGPGM